MTETPSPPPVRTYDLSFSPVEREPLTVTIPADTAQVTRYLVAAHCVPLAIRDTREEAIRFCEDAERAQWPADADLQFAWYPQEPADDSPEELYVTASGDEDSTEYTVTPIVIHVAAKAFTSEEISPEAAAHVLFHLGRGGWPASQFIQNLLRAFEVADVVNRARLGAGFPGYLAAFELVRGSDTGMAQLQAIAEKDGDL